MCVEENGRLERRSSVLLVSQDQSLLKELANSLASSFSIEMVASAENIASRLDSLAGDRVGVLLDWAARESWESQLAVINRKSVVLLAVLNDAGDRGDAFRVGVDDILLRPISSAELAIRLAFPRTEITVEQAGLISIGRLTSRLCHEINNSLQATRGALALAMEEPSLSDDVNAYLKLCNSENQRLTALARRMRNIYRPDPEFSMILLDSLLGEIVYLVADQVNDRQITLVTDFRPGLAPVRSSYDLVLLAILSLMLNLCAGMHPETRSTLRLTLSGEAGSILVTLAAENTPLRFDEQPKREDARVREELVALSPAREILVRLGIHMKLQQESGVSRILLKFPIRSQ